MTRTLSCPSLLLIFLTVGSPVAPRISTWSATDMAGGIGYRDRYDKPVIYDECKYEGDIPQGWGNLDAKTIDPAVPVSYTHLRAHET